MIIGLGHQKQVGKDAVADYLVRTHNFTHLSFATPLKTLCGYITDSWEGKYKPEDARILMHKWACLYIDKNTDKFDEPMEMVYDILRYKPISLTKKEDGKYRKLLQHVGTDIFRATDDTFWIKAMDTLLKSIPSTINVVISDVRFPNEKDFVEQLANGYAVKVKRDTKVDTHPSEMSLANADWKYIIDNSKDMPHLYAQVDDLVSSIWFEDKDI